MTKVVREDQETKSQQQQQQQQQVTQSEEFEPETFFFNESFDAHLLNLKPKRTLSASSAATNCSSISSSSFLLPCSSWSMAASCCSSVDLIRNLNKLNNNNNNKEEQQKQQGFEEDFCDFQLDHDHIGTGLINSTALFVKHEDEKAAAAVYHDFSAELMDSTIICQQNSTQADDDDDGYNHRQEYFYSENNLFKTFIHQSILTSSLFKSSEPSLLQFKPSLFRLSPKSMALSSRSRNHHHHRRRRRRRRRSSSSSSRARAAFRARPRATISNKSAFKRSTATRRTRRRSNKLLKPIRTLLVQSVCRVPEATSAFYKRSCKVEKLLNDSRGMKKYLIDYDDMCELMRSSNNNTTPAAEAILEPESSSSSSSSSSAAFSLSENEAELTRLVLGLDSISEENKPNSFSSASSNRCSSGYLSD